MGVHRACGEADDIPRIDPHGGRVERPGARALAAILFLSSLCSMPDAGGRPSAALLILQKVR